MADQKAPAKKARKKAEIPADETKEQRFKRIAEPRVNKAVDQLDLLIKMVQNRTSYAWGETTVNTIVDSVQSRVKTLYDLMTQAAPAGSEGKTKITL